VRAIDFLDHGLRREPDRLALRDATRTFTHDEVHRLTHRIAHALRGAGLKRGARVAFYTPNCALAFVAMISVFRAGCVWQPVHPRNALGAPTLAETVGKLAILLTQGAEPARFLGGGGGHDRLVAAQLRM